jgi:thymidylate synthase
MNKEEQKYLDLLQDILDNGSNRDDRTGVGTKSLFGTQLRFSLYNNKIPMLTTKKIFIRGVIEELLFFLRGETDTKKLEEKGVMIWHGNTTREFLDKRGLQDYDDGEMGPRYGKQWRSWGSQFDQIGSVLKLLKNDPNSRRIVVSTWNVEDLDKMCLEPCIPLWQCYVAVDKLSLQWTQRSSDALLGFPWNLASFAILTKILAKTAGLEPHEVIFSGGDTHIYNSHTEQVTTQISREPYPFPELYIDKDIHTIQDIEQLQFEDFRIENYKCWPAIQASMAV